MELREFLAKSYDYHYLPRFIFSLIPLTPSVKALLVADIVFKLAETTSLRCSFDDGIVLLKNPDVNENILLPKSMIRCFLKEFFMARKPYSYSIIVYLTTPESLTAARNLYNAIASALKGDAKAVGEFQKYVN